MTTDGGWIDPKDPGATVTVTFGFSEVAETIVSATVSAGVLGGRNDPSPAAIISGPVSITGAEVRQRVTGGQAGTAYLLRCVANDADGEVHVLTAAMLARTSTPSMSDMRD